MTGFDIRALGEQLLYDPKNPLLFNNGFFVYFFAAFIVLYYLLRDRLAMRRYVFCFFSLYFFYKASGSFVGLVIVSAIVDFILSNAIHRQTIRSRRTALLLLSILFNLGLLFYFKYTDFFIELSNTLFQTGFQPLNLLLPVGISFYTFENLSYTLDVYRGELEPARKFSDYLLFLSFFPKLVMGPIVRAHDFVPQINQPWSLRETDFAQGFYLIFSGLFKKLIISDYLTLNFVDFVFDDPARYSGLENLLAVYGYAVVIYCDFSGYSDVALGIARWLGFSLPVNFLSPYQSGNITEFWRRWHISLSSWLRDYLYIPLGGNRGRSIASLLFPALFFGGLVWSGQSLFGLTLGVSILIALLLLALFILPAILQRNRQTAFTGMNLFTTMLLGGFWHGASFNFLIWGALHGFGLAIHKLWLMGPGSWFNTRPTGGWVYKALMLLLTFHFVCFGWVFFKADSFDLAGAMLHQITHDFSFSVWPAFFGNYKMVVGLMALAFLLHAIPDDWATKRMIHFARAPLLVYLLIFAGFVLLYGVFKAAEPVMPIYLQF